MVGPTGLLPAALSCVSSRSHAAVLPSVHPAVYLPGLEQPVAPGSLLGLLPPGLGRGGSQPGTLPTPKTISRCLLLQT